MKRRTFLSACFVGLAPIALMLILVTASLGYEPSARFKPAALELEQDPPAIAVVVPNEAPNNLDTTIVISGTGFQAVLSGTQVLTAPVVSLDDFSLVDVGWVSSHTLTATVPWGLDPGIYAATVTNPDGQLGQLPSAFIVTQAIGVWTTGGPYGGMVTDVAVSPVADNRAFAVTSEVGLFRTEDGGDNWELALYDPIAWGVEYGIAPTHTLYFWGLTGLWRSEDDGLTFQRVIEADVTAFGPDPADEQRFWIGVYPNDVLYTANGGSDWEARGEGLPEDDWASDLVVDPSISSTVYAVLSGGRVYKTINAGTEWLPLTNGLPTYRSDPPHTLAINPFAPNVLLLCQFSGSIPALRSTDGGLSWSPVQIEPEHEVITDLAFSPYLSGTVYASMMQDNLVGISTDGGATWEPMAPKGLRDHVISIALDPLSGLPAYLGAIDSGASRSHDGGLTWELATHGITALRLYELAAVPGSPETVYAVGGGAGAFFSTNAGQSWGQMILPYAYGFSVAVDPQQHQRLYISPGHDMFRSPDGGQTWDLFSLGDNSQAVFVERLAISNSAPNAVYAAGRHDLAFTYGRSIGIALRSDDYGASWTPLSFTLPISAVADIIVDPTDSLRVYIAAGTWAPPTAHIGKGVFRSSDGGQTWEKASQGMGDVPAFSLAIHPSQPLTVYATAWLTGEEKVTVFKSLDGGEHWTPTSLRAGWRDDPGAWVPSLVVDPLSPYTLYAGAEDGLYQTTDGGATWTRASGSLGMIPIVAQAVASSSERTILYAATRGGSLSGPSPRSRGAFYIASDYVQGGVYQQTMDYRPPKASVYLPLVLKNR